MQGDPSLDSTKLSNNPSLVIVCLVPAGQPASVAFNNKSSPCNAHCSPRPTASASRIYLALVAPAPYLPYRLAQDPPLPPRPTQQLLPRHSTRDLRSVCAPTSRCSYILISRTTWPQGRYSTLNRPHRHACCCEGYPYDRTISIAGYPARNPQEAHCPDLKLHATQEEPTQGRAARAAQRCPGPRSGPHYGTPVPEPLDAPGRTSRWRVLS